MSVQLTTGSAARLQYAEPDEEEIFSSSHTLQILSIKKVNNSSNATGVDRYRIIMSDGEYFIQAMLATQLNAMVQNNSIGKHTVVLVEKVTCNFLKEKRLLIVLSLRVVENLDIKIGDPVQIPDHRNTESAPPAAVPNATTNMSPTSSSSSVKPVVQQNQITPSHQQMSAKGRPSVYPIEGLSPYQNNWTIKARVTFKSDIKTWSNQRGEGKLFNVTLMDETGEIRGTGFNLVVDELYPKLEEGKVYYISKARVNLAKKKFSNLQNDYELSFERNTEIEECHETTNVPMIKYNFVPLSGLQDLPKDTTCDVIGVVKEASPISEIISKQSRAVSKRELTLVDKSGFSVRLTLWGKQAEQYTADDKPIIAFKGVKVGDFGGRSLSMFSSSTMQINPDIDECFALRGWYDSSGAEQSFQAHSNAVGAGASMSFNRSDIKSLDDVKQSQLGTPDKPENFSTRATIMHIKADNISYPACPTQNCNKKVVEDHNGWKCEKCDQTFAAPEHRYIMSLAVADYSGQAWLQGFNDVGLAVFGMTANELLEIKDRDEAKYNVILHKANCNTYNFACRAKQDTYNEMTRVRYGITRIYSLDYKEEAMALRDLLHSPWAQ